MNLIFFFFFQFYSYSLYDQTINYSAVTASGEMICKPWHDTRAIACAHAVTCANQEKGGLGGR